jgi:putative ABC transport system permease protein
MKIPLRSGRHFTDRDQSEYFTAEGRITHGFADYESNERDVPGVAIINETLARRCFADGNPLGRKLMVDDGSRRVREIVGVIGDVKHLGLDKESKPEIYLPYAQRPTQNQTLVIRTTSDPTTIVAAVRGEVRSMDKDLPLYGIRTMEDYLTDSIAARRLNLMLLGIFAAVALVLAAIGIYGVISYAVAQRTQEIGIRMALGAQRGDVLRMILKQGMTLAGLGVVIGLAASLALTRLMQTLLFEISPTDPLTFFGISLLLTIVASAACYLPARRALKVDPMIALRYE